MDDATWDLVLAFDRDGPADGPFVCGFECGRLWEQLKQPEGFEQTIHAENVEMVMWCGCATRREMRIEDLDDDWCVLIVAPAA